MQQELLEKIDTYDSITQIEAAMLLSGDTNIESTSFKESLERIDRAIDAKTLEATHAIANAKARGLIIKAIALQLSRILHPIFGNEKQTIIKMKDFKVWSKKDDVKVLGSREFSKQLLLLAVLAKKLTPQDRNRVSMMKQVLEAHGVTMNEKTIRKHINLSLQTLSEAV